MTALEQVINSNHVKEDIMAQDIGAQHKAKRKKNKRLYEFHHKLSNHSGLPPSRLMVQQTPKLDSTGGIKFQ